MSDEITLRVNVPDVTETLTRVEVRCGDTAVSVHEHSRAGSGAWMVWTLSGNRAIGETGDFHAVIEDAIAEAQRYVRREERLRLMHVQLRALLARTEVP